MGKRFRSAVFLLVILLAAICIMPQAQEAQAATLRLNKVKVTLAKGAKVNLKVAGTNKRPKWSTDKKKVATVTSKGVVTAKGKGVARITAKIGKKKLVCRVTVEAPNTNSVAGIDIGDFYTIKTGKSKVLRAYIYPLHSTNKYITWKSSNENIVKVDQNGVVKGMKLGTARVTAVCGGKKTSCRIDVIPSSISIVLSNTYQKVRTDEHGKIRGVCETKISKILFDGKNITDWKIWPYKEHMRYTHYGYSGLSMSNWGDFRLDNYWESRSQVFSFQEITDRRGEFSLGMELYGLYASAKFVVEKIPE